MIWKLIVGNPWVFGILAAVIAAGYGWAIWERHDAVAAIAERDAARLKSDLHEADAIRYRASDEALRKVVAGLNERIDRQNAGADRANAARERALSLLATAERQASVAQQDLIDLERRIMESAHAHPNDVHPLGAPACDVYRSLYGEAAACTDPRTHPAP